MTQPSIDRRGEAGKRAALETHARTNPAVVLAGQRALLRTLLAFGSATIDAVRALVPLPPGTNPKVFGAVPAPLVKAGLIAPGGFVKSGRGAAHARPLTRWQLVDRAKAEAWLAAHPEPVVPPATLFDAFD